jgi:hypothetical protein
MVKKALALLVALGGLVAFSGMAFANCAGHVNQAQIDQSEAPKTVATKPTPKAQLDKLLLAKSDRPDQPASEKK